MGMEMVIEKNGGMPHYCSLQSSLLRAADIPFGAISFAIE